MTTNFRLPAKLGERVNYDDPCPTQPTPQTTYLALPILPCLSRLIYPPQFMHINSMLRQTL